jgi:hypothetical protein
LVSRVYLGALPEFVRHCPTVADQPQLVADLIADLLSDDGQRDLSASRVALVEEARTRLTGSARQRFRVGVPALS